MSEPTSRAAKRAATAQRILDAARAEFGERGLEATTIRRIARRMAILAIGARLAEQGNAYAEDTGSGRLAWIAARFLARLGGEAAVAQLADDPAWLAHAEPILHGGHVPLDAARLAANTVASHVVVSAAA